MEVWGRNGQHHVWLQRRQEEAPETAQEVDQGNGQGNKQRLASARLGGNPGTPAKVQKPEARGPHQPGASRALGHQPLQGPGSEDSLAALTALLPGPPASLLPAASPPQAGPPRGYASRQLPAPRGPLPASAPPPRAPGRPVIGLTAPSLSGRVTALVSDRGEPGSGTRAGGAAAEGTVPLARPRTAHLSCEEAAPRAPPPPGEDSQPVPAPTWAAGEVDQPPEQRCTQVPSAALPTPGGDRARPCPRCAPDIPPLWGPKNFAPTPESGFGGRCPQLDLGGCSQWPAARACLPTESPLGGDPEGARFPWGDLQPSCRVWTAWMREILTRSR
ncbi:PREDICTED: basic proline-rich protein-like [Elephantulus edwardii]|uniref:basic proline-rich protein-like n=1 Tax=Elephantulus edwardii TaxID=28737 RepID=UPI0003F0613D|nr:PREDICTED: basic proline-rich protein-like [Elephantulus edwardii]